MSDSGSGASYLRAASIISPGIISCDGDDSVVSADGSPVSAAVSGSFAGMKHPPAVIKDTAAYFAD